MEESHVVWKYITDNIWKSWKRMAARPTPITSHDFHILSVMYFHTTCASALSFSNYAQVSFTVSA